MSKTDYILGLDLGGTRLKLLALTPQGIEIERGLAPSEGPNWASSVKSAVKDIVVRLGAPTAAGLAAPGLASKDGRSIAFMPGRLPGLENLIWTDFLDIGVEVPVLNDGHAALLGEVWRGGARGSENAVLITLGTGVGGAAVVDGRLLRGHIGRAGHVGHTSLNPAGELGITNTPGSLEDAVGNHSLGKRTGGRYTSTAQLVMDALAGDTFARDVWDRMIRDLGASVASIINVLDPEVILIGGGIAEAGDALLEPLGRMLDRFEWRPGGHKVRLARAQLGDLAGAYGAAWQGMNQQSERI